MLKQRVAEREKKAAAEVQRRREVERKRRAVLFKLRRRKERLQRASTKQRPLLVGFADLFLSADDAGLAGIAALLRVDAPGVEKVARACQQPLGRRAASASQASDKIGHNIAAAVAPLLAGLLRLLSFQDNPDPLGVFRLVLANRRFRRRCFGEADLLAALTSSERGKEAVTAVAVRDSWRQLMREKNTGRACGTLALALKGFSSRDECAEFFSDIKPIEVGSPVLVGKRPHLVPPQGRKGPAGTGRAGDSCQGAWRVTQVHRGHVGRGEGLFSRIRAARRHHPTHQVGVRRGECTRNFTAPG